MVDLNMWSMTPGAGGQSGCGEIKSTSSSVTLKGRDTGMGWSFGSVSQSWRRGANTWTGLGSSATPPTHPTTTVAAVCSIRHISLYQTSRLTANSLFSYIMDILRVLITLKYQ